MATVLLTPTARVEFDALHPPIRGRVAAVIERLAHWPQVSGAKPLRGALKGSFRLRTGEYRVIFRLNGDTVMVTGIDLRRDIYED